MAEVKRRLSTRRGSVSAADPYGTHTEHETNRNTSARLTIVRVPKDSSGSESNSPPSLRSEALHRRGSSGGSEGKGPARLSFAFASFTPIHADTSGPPSPPASSRAPTRKGSGASLGDRPSSLVFSPRQSTLSPQQLFDLAASSTRPPPKSPIDPDEPENGGFIPMPDSHFLPFIDRPGEVASLLSKPPNNRVLALLAQTFPQSKTHQDLPNDPKTWSFKTLRHHLFKTTREECNDAEWVHKARSCVAGKSELIWERLKGALGVPPELDYDQFHDGSGGISISVDAGSLSDSILSDEPEEYEQDETWTVEPIFAGSEPISSPLSPVVEHDLYFGFGGAERGMENIGEEQEEAGRQNSQDHSPGNGGTPTGENPKGLEAIHGLRISTSAMSATSSRSPMMGGIIGRSLSSSGAFTSSPMIRPRGGSLSREETRQVRDPGNPLFPGSFASLSVGPTFVTSNPSHRTTGSKHSVPIMGKRYPRFAARSDDGYSDNAITFVSSDSETSFVAR